MRDHFDPRVLPAEALAFIRGCQSWAECHLGGGSALSGAWLAHRLSRDIDLFCHDSVQHRELISALPHIAQASGAAWKIVQDGRHHVRAILTLSTNSMEVDVVEFLGGFRKQSVRNSYQSKLGAYPFLETTRAAYDRAAELLAAHARLGAGDAIIAATAIETGSALFTIDPDFDALASQGLTLFA